MRAGRQFRSLRLGRSRCLSTVQELSSHYSHVPNAAGTKSLSWPNLSSCLASGQNLNLDGIAVAMQSLWPIETLNSMRLDRAARGTYNPRHLSPE